MMLYRALMAMPTGIPPHSAVDTQLAGTVGFEPTVVRVTTGRSTTELHSMVSEERLELSTGCV